MSADVPTGNGPLQPKKPTRHWLQFRLRTLLVVAVVSGVALAWIGLRWEQRRKQSMWKQERSNLWDWEDMQGPGQVNLHYHAIGSQAGVPHIVFLFVEATGYSELQYDAMREGDGGTYVWKFIPGRAFTNGPVTPQAADSDGFLLYVNAPDGNPFRALENVPPPPIFFKGTHPTHAKLLAYWKNTIEPLFKKYPQREEKLEFHVAEQAK
jgi:hypothetical protein